jgi:hypothetical protein
MKEALAAVVTIFWVLIIWVIIVGFLAITPN